MGGFQLDALFGFSVAGGLLREGNLLAPRALPAMSGVKKL